MSEENENNILIIVAARLARRELLTRLHGLCDLEQRVVSTRNVRDAVEHAESALNREVSKIVRGHDMLTKKLRDAESEVARLSEQVRALAAENALMRDGVNRIAIAYTQEVPASFEIDRVRCGIDTPATDAALREVGARAVEGFVVYATSQSGFDCDLTVDDAEDYAARIRAGEVQP